MFQYYPYLSDASFLQELDNARNYITYARITVTDMDENPIGSIEGYTNQGTIYKKQGNIRLSGNLSLVADEENYRIEDIDNIIAINKKVFIEIGRQNVLDKYTDYDIIWFPQGLVGITQASIQHTTQAYTISINFKDKMVFLNGELGGTLPAPIVFSPLSSYDAEKKDWYEEPALIETILFTLINEHGGIPKDKIFIKDIDKTITNICTWGVSQPGWRTSNRDRSNVRIMTDPPIGTSATGQVINWGDMVGYIEKDFVYPGTLTSNTGDSITSVLDTIQNVLGNFEYFFDTNGNFIWQQIPNYLNNTNDQYNLMQPNENTYLRLGKDSGKAVYSLKDTSLITSISNNPEYAKIKNDFMIWGKKNNLPIRYHAVLDTIPSKEKSSFTFSLDQDDYETDEDIKKAKYTGRWYAIPGNDITVSTSNMDWRTYIYLDYVCNKDNANYIKSPYAEELYANWPLLVNLKDLETTGDGSCSFIDNLWEGSYFLDIIDSPLPEISQFNVSKIGRRTIVFKEDSINCLAYPTPGTPGSQNVDTAYLFSASTAKTENYRNYYKSLGKYYSQVRKDIFDTCINKTLSSYSAFEYICSIIHEYVVYNEKISVQLASPILYLMPNTRIQILDPETNTAGDYLIDSLSLSFTSAGTMNISAKKALQRYGDL